MFGLFKEDPRKALEKKYKALLQEAFDLSKIDRQASDAKTAEADEIMKEIEKLA